jgi:hypothetical protein
MIEPEFTSAERKALEATKLESFPVNLPEVRRTIATLLTEFGRYGFFNEYTTHSFDHVYDMLVTLDWLIPADTQKVMSKGDWLMTVLACYFHDLGLLITRKEFENRDSVSLQGFCKTVLFAGPEGADYQAKIRELPQHEQEKFLYQEYVRYNHAIRVRAWIEGNLKTDIGQRNPVAEEIDRLLSSLDVSFRRDLAIVCESHNLNDLENTAKYKLSKPYGNSEDETVNLQYIAAILRIADLVQITKRRAPSVLYRVINPRDPVSQIEWLKQNAVRRIRPKPALDRDGNPSKTMQSDTIEVYAHFERPEGFFGLSSYLRYAAAELQLVCSLVECSRKGTLEPYSFPWRFIDDTNIEAEGFLTQPFGFEIDQERILDLLTGHTLYNDSSVVIRELAQNAIDAVRLQALEDVSSTASGKVEIRWNSNLSELEVLDNGTGMTQEIIERHLLKVGASRYQEPKFKELHPTFSPISRFGIGVLSAFMIADSVEIITCTPSEEMARQISLRSVHGKYLVQLLSKTDHPIANQLAPHGSLFRLKFRASAKKVDVLETAKRWILFPRCRVTVAIDDAAPIGIGYDSPKDSLESHLRQFPNRYPLDSYKVIERSSGPLTLAFAVMFDELFRDWSFVAAPDFPDVDKEERPFVQHVLRESRWNLHRQASKE